jgi:hypothetical protein
MRNLLIEPEAGKPAPGQMHAQLLDQFALAGDAIQIVERERDSIPRLPLA